MAAPVVADSSPPEEPSASPPAISTWARLGLIALVLAFALVHIAAVFREGVNWDEFALLWRSAETLRSGKLVGGGRPGFATLLLIPFVEGCRISTEAVIGARLFWSLFTFGYLGGIYVLASRFDGGRRWSRAGVLAVGLIALIPLFQRWSVQVRTDQPALAFAVWGAVTLLASRRRLALALLAGTLFAIGFLFSQKAGYILGLSGLLAAGAGWTEKDIIWRRDVKRAAYATIGGIATYFAYLGAVSLFFEPATTNLAGTIASMGFYRQLGMMSYRSLPPLLIPHALLTLFLLLATVRKLRERGDGLRRCLLAWAVLGLGVVVATVHGSRFAYFWMTLGIFPALAFAIAKGSLFDRLSARARIPILSIVGLLLLLRAVPTAGEIMRDTISPQTRSLTFIERNFPADARGFHPEKALFCRATVGAVEPTYFTATIHRRFSGPEGVTNQKAFIDDFRAHPVSYLVDSFRLSFFPPSIRQFWANSYVRYAEGVFIAGRYLEGPPGSKLPFEVIVPGDYVFHLPEGHPPVRLGIDDRVVEAGSSFELSPGLYEIELLDPVMMGMVTLRLDEGPNPASVGPFYNPVVVAELDGRRRWSWVPGL